MRVNRHPFAGPAGVRLAHRERIDWHDHAEHQLVYPSSGVLHVRTDRGAWVAAAAPRGMASRRGPAQPPRPRPHPDADARVSRRAQPAAQCPQTQASSATEPTVLAVGQLLREVIIALAEDQLPQPRGPRRPEPDRPAPPHARARPRATTCPRLPYPRLRRRRRHPGRRSRRWAHPGRARARDRGQRANPQPAVPARHRDDVPAMARAAAPPARHPPAGRGAAPSLARPRPAATAM